MPESDFYGILKAALSVSAKSPRGETDITADFGSAVGGSNPPEDTNVKNSWKVDNGAFVRRNPHLFERDRKRASRLPAEASAQADSAAHRTLARAMIFLPDVFTEIIFCSSVITVLTGYILCSITINTAANQLYRNKITRCQKLQEITRARRINHKVKGIKIINNQQNINL